MTLDLRAYFTQTDLSFFCLSTTNFKYNEGFHRQKHGCAMGSPLSPIGANLYLEEVEHRALGSFKGTTPRPLGMWTTSGSRSPESRSFRAHLSSVDRNIKFTREDMNENRMLSLNSEIHLQKDGGLNIQVHQKLTHTDQYLFFNSHHPLEHKLGVTRTLHHQAENVPTRTEWKSKNTNTSRQH